MHNIYTIVYLKLFYDFFQSQSSTSTSIEGQEQFGTRKFSRFGGRSEPRNNSESDQKANKYLYKSSKESGSTFFDDVDEAILKGQLSDTQENEELVGKSEIVEKFIKVVENSENNYFADSAHQQNESSKSSRNNPFGKGDLQPPNSREDIRKKLAFGGFGSDASSLRDSNTKKQGKSYEEPLV